MAATPLLGRSRLAMRLSPCGHERSGVQSAGCGANGALLGTPGQDRAVPMIGAFSHRLARQPPGVARSDLSQPNIRLMPGLSVQSIRRVKDGEVVVYTAQSTPNRTEPRRSRARLRVEITSEIVSLHRRIWCAGRSWSARSD